MIIWKESFLDNIKRSYALTKGFNYKTKENMVMSKSLQIIEKLDTIQPLYEMANLGPKRTGLPVVIYVSLEVTNHTPRIKVARKAN